jgi:hypothetical protein
MTRLFLITLLIVGHLSYGQSSYPTKSELIKALTKETKVKKKSYKPTYWFTFESHSSYKTADTITFFNNYMYHYGKENCNRIYWSFFKMDAFYLQEVTCNDQANAGEADGSNDFTFEISNNQYPMVFQVFSKMKLVEKFEVLSLTKKILHSESEEIVNVLTLRRIKKDELD